MGATLYGMYPARFLRVKRTIEWSGNLEIRAKKMATPPGFEPRLTGPKPVVLPLHHGGVCFIKYHRLR